MREVKTLAMTPMSGVILLFQNAVSYLFPFESLTSKTQVVGRARIIIRVLQSTK